MRTYLDAKAMAKSLRAALAAKNVTLSHSECLELVSKQIGFSEWNMLAAKIALETTPCEPSTSETVSLQPPVPVVPVASAVEARAFYLEFLGFAADWGWPAQRPLYAQVSRSGVSLHLREDRAANAATELLIRMTGLDALHTELSSKARPYELTVHQTPDDRREIHVRDPFGNRLRFSENNPPGRANS
jgi:hypothetical protein